MYGVTSLTQKGQVVIPKPIRDLFDLKAFDKVVFTVVKDKIVVKPAMTVDEAYGMMASGKKPITKEKMKRTLSDFLENQGLTSHTRWKYSYKTRMECQEKKGAQGVQRVHLKRNQRAYRRKEGSRSRRRPGKIQNSIRNCLKTQ